MRMTTWSFQTTTDYGDHTEELSVNLPLVDQLGNFSEMFSLTVFSLRTIAGEIAFCWGSVTLKEFL